jgi:3-isopropylmalate/(R)-2-methylmalate dehydratase small subunit
MTATFGRVWKLGNDIDTDALAPGHTMKHGLDVTAKHCLESVRPAFAAGVRHGDIVVAGHGFGIGSSREQAAQVLVRLGVAAVVAQSYSGLFFRNGFNVGLLCLTVPDTAALLEGERVSLDLAQLRVVRETGAPVQAEPIPAFLTDMARRGGLLASLKVRLMANAAPNAAPNPANNLAAKQALASRVA